MSMTAKTPSKSSADQAATSSSSQSQTANISRNTTRSQSLVNLDPSSWTVADTGNWLQRIGLAQYVTKFTENDITGKVR